MTKEEAKSFLINISYKFGNMGVEYLTEKDGDKMREAIEVLGQATAAKDITTDMSIQLMLEKKAIEKDLEENPIDMDMIKGLTLGLLLTPDERGKWMDAIKKVLTSKQNTDVSDKIKEEINAKSRMHMDGDLYIKTSECMQIIDKYKEGSGE